MQGGLVINEIRIFFAIAIIKHACVLYFLSLQKNWERQKSWIVILLNMFSAEI